jgi:hypothetical protein
MCELRKTLDFLVYKVFLSILVSTILKMRMHSLFLLNKMKEVTIPETRLMEKHNSFKKKAQKCEIYADF